MDEEKMKTQKDAKFIGSIAGCPEIVDSRPDLRHHLETHLSTISTPELNSPEEEAPMESGYKPPMPPKTSMNANPWSPPGRR